MKKLRETTWEDYGISRHRYLELKAFCLQYDEKKNKISRNRHQLNSGKLTEYDLYQQDVRMIEAAAVEANPFISEYILKSVTKDAPFEQIEYDAEHGRIPSGKTDFYAIRRCFYDCLNKMQMAAKLSMESA